MVAHGARSLLVKLLDMKMWDGSLVKYFISILVCLAAGIFCEILISHSLRIFWIHRILLHGGKPWDQKRNSNLSPNEASSNPYCFCYCRWAVDNTIIAYIVCCGNFLTLSGKYSRSIVASSQRNHLGCVGRLCWFVAIGGSCSVVVICFVLNHDEDKLWPSNASSLKSMIDRGLG